MPSQISK